MLRSIFKSFVVISLAAACVKAEVTKTVYNPFTSNLDYITALTTSSIQAGSNVTVSTTASGVTISATASGGGGTSASTLAVATGTSAGFTLPGSSPTAVINLDSTYFTSNLQGASTAFVSITPTGLLTQSSATATYLQLSSATVTYAPISGSSNYIQNTGALQSGSTFYTSSGTVSGTLTVGTSTVNGNLTVGGFSTFNSTITVPSTQGFVRGQIEMSYDGGGTVLTAGTTYWVLIPSSGTITSMRIAANPSGTVSVNVSKSSAFGASGASIICASACPSLTSATFGLDSTLSGWTTSIAKDSFMYFVINASPVPASITALTVYINYAKQ